MIFMIALLSKNLMYNKKIIVVGGELLQLC